MDLYTGNAENIKTSGVQFLIMESEMESHFFLYIGRDYDCRIRDRSGLNPPPSSRPPNKKHLTLSIGNLRVSM